MWLLLERKCSKAFACALSCVCIISQDIIKEIASQRLLAWPAYICLIALPYNNMSEYRTSADVRGPMTKLEERRPLKTKSRRLLGSIWNGVFYRRMTLAQQHDKRNAAGFDQGGGEGLLQLQHAETSRYLEESVDFPYYNSLWTDVTKKDYGMLYLDSRYRP